MWNEATEEKLQLFYLIFDYLPLHRIPGVRI